MKSIAYTHTNEDNVQAKALAGVVMVVEQVRATHPHGYNLEEPTVELLDAVEAVILYENGNAAGVALVTKDAEIKCVCGSGGILKSVIDLAVLAGGRWLTTYDTGLVEKYEKLGFIITGREAFDPVKGDHVPRSVGTPDVVTLEYDPA